ncbi:MAG: DsrE family protein [Bacteroidia bacterium]|nr:DsrE family protein [Bacteroidia bacterium]
MKKNIFIATLLVFAVQLLQAQTTDYKVVFDLTSKDSLDQKAVMRWVNEVSASSPQAKIEVVMYGQGVSMVTKGRSNMEETISKFYSNKNISFKVCAIALKNQNIDKTLLMPGIEIVPDGIYEIISKQRDGWGYIKAVH